MIAYFISTRLHTSPRAPTDTVSGQARAKPARSSFLCQEVNTGNFLNFTGVIYWYMTRQNWT